MCPTELKADAFAIRMDGGTEAVPYTLTDASRPPKVAWVVPTVT